MLGANPGCGRVLFDEDACVTGWTTLVRVEVEVEGRTSVAEDGFWEQEGAVEDNGLQLRQK